jgi:predicted Zn-dependent peptidase
VLRHTQLPGGLEVVTEAMPGADSVTAGFWVGTGARDEAPGDEGASHFLEHLLFKGTEHRSGTEIDRIVDAVGGDMNAFTAREYTAFYLRLLGEQLDLALELLSDVLWRATLAEEQLAAERGVILEEILMHTDDPADLSHELASSALFPGHGLGRDVLGTSESVGGMDAGRLRAFFDMHYRPANMVFAAAGALDHDRVVEGVAERLSERSGGARPTRVGPGRAPASVVVHPRRTEQAHLVVAMRAPDRHDPRRAALDVVDHALGGGLSSRLFQEVRERRGLAYSVYSDRVAYDDAGAIVVYAAAAPRRIGEVAEVLAAELDRMARTGPTEEELAVAKGHLRASLLLSLEDTGARMSRIGRSQLLHGEVLPVEELLGRTEAVGLDDAAALAAEVLGAPRSAVLVGPFSRRRPSLPFGEESS